jgi:hypothetical protein
VWFGDAAVDVVVVELSGVAASYQTGTKQKADFTTEQRPYGTSSYVGPV